jgi:hypothetical protein
MALFGAPIAHEDHALRACYAALALQSAIRPYAEEVRRTHGLLLQLRVGLNSGEVVVRAIGNFDQAAELLRRSVEAVGRESGTPSADLRIGSLAWLARILGALGDFAAGQRYGEEALRLATWGDVP